jgi:hypothetical protein
MFFFTCGKILFFNIKNKLFGQKKYIKINIIKAKKSVTSVPNSEFCE